MFISHKLNEVLSFADRITVMRDGAVTGEVLPEATSRQQLADLMVGRPVKLVADRQAIHLGTERLVVSGLRVAGERRPVAVDDVTFAVRSGEVLGIAGVSGNGQRELAEALAGLRPASAGQVVVNGTDVSTASPRGGATRGLAYVPEERMREGAIGSFAVWENLLLLDHGSAPFASAGLLHMRAIRRHSRALVADYDVRTPGLDAPDVDAVGRQHPEADHGAGAGVVAGRVRRVAAHSRRRHRRRRVHPRPPDGGSGRRARDCS